jgi:hypothetical protein
MAGRFETLWYEDNDGNYYPYEGFDTSTPEGATIQVSRFPFQLTTTYLTLKEGGGSSLLMRANSGYSSDLMLAMIRPSAKELAKQFVRYGWFAKVQEPKMAVFLAAATCERCTNSLAHRYGLDWGYRGGSDKWHLAGTSCNRCEHLGMGKFWVQDEEGNWGTSPEGKAASKREYAKYCASRGMTVEEMHAKLDAETVACDPVDEEEE